jgi:hypothetical protein
MGRLAKVFRVAADRFLWKGGLFGLDNERYSCDAIWAAIAHIYSAEASRLEIECEIDDLLVNAGMKDFQKEHFRRFRAGEDRQAVRHAWLHLLAQYCEDEGL